MIRELGWINELGRIFNQIKNPPPNSCRRDDVQSIFFAIQQAHRERRNGINQPPIDNRNMKIVLHEDGQNPRTIFDLSEITRKTLKISGDSTTLSADKGTLTIGDIHDFFLGDSTRGTLTVWFKNDTRNINNCLDLYMLNPGDQLEIIVEPVNPST